MNKKAKVLTAALLLTAGIITTTVAVAAEGYLNPVNAELVETEGKATYSFGAKTMKTTSNDPKFKEVPVNYSKENGITTIDFTNEIGYTMQHLTKITFQGGMSFKGPTSPIIYVAGQEKGIELKIVGLTIDDLNLYNVTKFSFKPATGMGSQTGVTFFYGCK